MRKEPSTKANTPKTNQRQAGLTPNGEEAILKAKRREHFVWQEHVVGRDDVSAVFKTIAWALALFKNCETGRCDPSYGTLAKRAGVSESTAKRAIAEFERLGLIAIERSTGGSSVNHNKYRLLFPEEASRGVTVETPQGVSAEASRGVRTGSGGVSELRHTNMKKNKKNKTRGREAPPPARERENASLVDLVDVGAAGAAHAGEAKQESRPEIIAPYEELRTIWNRGHGKDRRPDRQAADRRAFTEACREVAPGTIIAGAQAWVAAADHPRFLQPLAEWLEDRNWEHDPPQKRLASPRRAAPRNRNGGFVDIDRILAGMVS